jgi:hypothetical protein
MIGVKVKLNKEFIRSELYLVFLPLIVKPRAVEGLVTWNPEKLSTDHEQKLFQFLIFTETGAP